MSSTTTASHVDDFCAAVRPLLASDQLQIDESSALEVGGLEPKAIVVPSSIEQIQRVLSEAVIHVVSVIPIGGGTHLGVGNVPSSYDVALSLARMHRIIAHEPADLTVTVEPGLRIDDLQRALAVHGQFLPLDPACEAASTIGGVLALNAYGPRRHAFGTARDWLIGTRVVHADGSLSKSGGRVVKNVTGYDMHKLYVGSLGTLGVLVEATLKVAPLPHSESTLAIGSRSAAHGAELILAAHDAGLALHAAELLSPPATHAVLGQSSWCALMRVAGGAGAVARSLREIDHAATVAGAAIETLESSTAWDAWSTTFRPRGLALRISVMPSRVGETMQVLDRRLTGGSAQLSATVTTGLIRASLDASSDGQALAVINAASEVAAQFDGSMVIDAAPAAVKRGIDVFGPTRSDFAIMKRLKDEFDPKRILSPGRFVGRL